VRASWAVPLAGILFILVWWAHRQGMEPARAASPRQNLGSAGWARRSALGVAFVLLALVAAEAVLPTSLLAHRTLPPARLAGRWEGQAKVLNSWGPPGELMVVVTVNGDGSVAGTVGAATLLNARIGPNRSWLGKALGLRSDYIVRGTLREAITPLLGLACPVVTFSADLEGHTLKGTLAGLDCRSKGKPEGTLQTAPMTLRQPGAIRR